MKYRLIFLQVLEVSDEPLGESNTEIQVKSQLIFQKKAPQNIFMIKTQNLRRGEGEDLGGTNQTDEQNFSQSKNLHESSKFEHFQGGGGG